MREASSWREPVKMVGVQVLTPKTWQKKENIIFKVNGVFFYCGERKLRVTVATAEQHEKLAC